MLSPQGCRHYLEHESVPSLGDSIIFPLVIIVWRAIVLVPLQHLLQEEVGRELWWEETTKGELARASNKEAE